MRFAVRRVLVDPEDRSVTRFALSSDFQEYLKSVRVRAHQRHLASGKVAQVHEHRRTGDTAQRDLFAPGAKWVRHGNSTEELYKHDGQWTPGRQQLHAEIVNRIVGTHSPQETPVLFFMGGGTASGKSTVVRSGQLTIDADSVAIDADAIKGMIPEYQEMVQARDERAAAYVHEESSHIAALCLQRSLGLKYHVALDGTGDSSLDKLGAKVRAAKQAGYQVHSTYVTCPTEVAIARSEARAAKTGRHVPAATIREIHRAVADVLPRALAAGLFDRCSLFDSTTPTPTLVASHEAGQTTILDPGKYAEFTNKAK